MLPVEFLRNALWYYDNYFIERDRADRHLSSYEQTDAELTKALDLLSTAETDIHHLRSTNTNLLGRVRVWRNTTLILGGSTVLLALTLGLTL